MVGFKNLETALAELTTLTTPQINTTGETPVKMDDTVWDDLRFPASAVRLSGSQPPTATLYKGGSVLSFPDNADKTIYFTVQLPHNYKYGTDLKPHMHLTMPNAGSGAGVENIKFDLTYSLANISDAFPAESTLTITADVQNAAADVHGYVPFAAIDGSGIDNVSTMILCSLTRDVSVADNYGDDIYLLEIDFHYEIDAIGSDEELTKFV